MRALSATLREDDAAGGGIYGVFDSTGRPRGRGCRGLAEGQPRSLRAGKIIVGAAGTVGCSDGYVVASLRFASHGTGAFEPPRTAAAGCGVGRNASRTRTELLGCGGGSLGGLKPRSWHRDTRTSPNGSGQPAESGAIRLDNATGFQGAADGWLRRFPRDNSRDFRMAFGRWPLSPFLMILARTTSS